MSGTWRFAFGDEDIGLDDRWWASGIIPPVGRGGVNRLLAVIDDEADDRVPGYASLDLVARGLLQELVMIYNGDNNGSIYLSALDATARLGLTDKRPALRAFEHLQDRGFITLAKDSHFAVKAAVASRARCWRLTWHAWPVVEK